jgi:hypothetical protein
MILKMPATTSELFNDLAKAVETMPQGDRNIFVLDLMKFCVDWQFAYLAIKEGQDNE